MKDLKTLVEGWLLFLWKLAYQNAFNCPSENEEHASSPEISLWKENEEKERKSSPGHIEVETWFFFFLILPQKMLGELIRMIFFFSLSAPGQQGP